MKKIICLLTAVLLCSGCSLNVGGRLKTPDKVVRVNEESAARRGSAPLVYNADHYPVRITNLNSKREAEEQVFERPPQRLVAVWQNSIETPMALGVGDRFIAGMGVPDRKYLLPEYRELYDAIPYTSLENLDLETILMMEPDLIIGWSSTFGAKVLRSTDFWHSRGIHTYIAKASAHLKGGQTLENEYEDIRNLGAVFDKREEAERIISLMQTEIQKVQSHSLETGRRPRVLAFESLGKELRVYGKNSLTGNIVKQLRGKLLAEESSSVGLEQIVGLDPDLILLVVSESRYGEMQDIRRRILELKALHSLECIQKQRVYLLPLYCIYTPGVRCLDGLQAVARAMYPELYKE